MRRKRSAAQKRHSDHVENDQTGHEGHSVRKAHYKGFEIEVETHYKFKVDGKPLDVHAHVLDSGHLHSPSLPNYGWPSALDFVRQLIDSFPDDFKPQKKAAKKTLASNKSSKKRSGKKKATAKSKKSSKKNSKRKS